MIRAYSNTDRQTAQCRNALFLTDEDVDPEVEIRLQCKLIDGHGGKHRVSGTLYYSDVEVYYSDAEEWLVEWD